MQKHNSFSFVTALRLKQLREEKGLSHQKLSEALSEQFDVTISRDSLMNYEVATPNHSSAYKNLGMRIEYLHALASFYGVSADYLLGLTDVKSPFTDTRAIVSKTGLTEDNVRLLGLLNVTNGPHTALANDLLSFLSHDDEMAIRYMQMRKAHDLPRPISWFDLYCEGKISYEEYKRATEENIEDGYIQLSGRAAFEYYCSKIADSVETHLIAKYSETARWNKSEDSE